MRISITLLSLLYVIGLSAQDKEQFKRMGGKAKAKAAAAEEVASENDADFQRLMTAAQLHFETRE